MFDERARTSMSPAGEKWWSLKYRFGGKEKHLSLGVFPNISLKVARERREEIRNLVANGIGPSQNRQVMKLA
jgi:Arm DNA-binding domain